MKLSPRILALASLVSIFAGAASAQVTTGRPPFGSFGGGPVDTVNVANLNVHLSIPAINKAGRGLPFTYHLGYDTSVWYPVGASGSQSWQPVQNWGWISETEGATGSLNSATTIYYWPGFYCVYDSTYFDYLDPFGIPHPIPLEAAGNCGSMPSAYKCNGIGINSYPASCPSTDGSGYAVVVNDIDPYFSVANSAGTSTIPPWNTNTGTAGETDSNGNQISVNGSGVFTDTLGQTALTIAGIAPSNTTFQYKDPNNNSQQYVMKYTSYTVKTAFGCSGIAEYSATQYLVTEIDLPDQGSVPSDKYTFSYETTPGYSPGSGVVTGRLTSVTLPTGGTITYTYAGGSSGHITCADGSAATLMRYTPDTGSNYWTYAHTESGTAWTTTITDPSSQQDQTVMNFQGIYQTEAQIYQGSTSGTLLKTTYTCYNGSASPCNSTSVTLPIAQKSTYIQWPGGLESETNTVYDKESYGGFYYSNGLVTEQDEYAYGNGSPGPLLRKTLTSYASLGNNIVGRPSQITIQDGSGNIKAQTTYTYDGGSLVSSGITTQHISVSGSRGNPTTVTQLVSGSSTISQNFTYFDTGMVNVSKDGKSNPTNYAYSSTYTGAYPTTITNALNQNTTVAYDINSGLVTSATDANNQTTTYAYDLMFRPTQVNYPDGGQSTFSYAPQYGGNYVEENDKLDTSPRYKTSYLWSDGLGRPARAAVTNGEAQSYDEAQNTCFNASGLVSLQGYPFQDSGWGSPISCSVAGDAYTYDALGRRTKITRADGSYGSISYSANCVTATDDQGTTRQACTNALGRLTSVTENPGGLNYTTTYAYDVLNNVTSVTQNGSHSRTFAYDDLSRLTSASDPESGTTSYTYDAASNFATRTDARNITTTYSYDALNRLTTKTYSDGTIQTNFQYDATSNWGQALSNPIGRLTEEWTGTTSNPTATIFSYDPMGRAAFEILCTPLNCPSSTSSRYRLNYTYDLLGDTTSYSNSAGVTLSQSFNLGTRATQVTSSMSDSQHPATLASGLHYNAVGAPTVATLGNGLTEAAAFNGLVQPCRLNLNSSGTALSSCTAGVPSGNLLDLSMGFNYGSGDNGNVMSWAATGQQTFNRSYTYDALNRLSTMSAPGSTCSGLSWTYDAWGNRTNQTATGGTCYTFSQAVDTNNRLTGSPYQYDAAGNMTHDATHSYFYDAENRLIQVDGTLGNCSTATACYIYDAEGRRWNKSTGGVATDYIYGLSGHVVATYGGGCGNTCWGAGYVYLNGHPLAEYWASTTYFFFDDHLGSTRLLTGYPTPSVAECDDYYPFGELTSCGGTSTTTHKFTGYERDTESNLDNAQARYYGSSLGRFMSPDPAGNAVADPSNPQSWNMYAYVNNSPLIFADPSGLCNPDDPSDPTCNGGGGCEDSLEGCHPACGIVFCAGPGQGPPPIPASVTLPGAPATTGLPPGIFATGPGIDYSWMYLLNWGLRLPDPGGLIIWNLTNGPNGSTGDYGEQFCTESDGCVYWNPLQGWVSQPPPTKMDQRPMTRLDKSGNYAACAIGESPDVFEPISVGPPRPAASTETPKMGQVPPGEEAARALAELLAGIASSLADFGKCVANVYRWPSAH